MNRLVPLILIALVLLLSAAKNVEPLKQRGKQGNTAKTSPQANAGDDQQTISPAFAATFLETLRAVVKEQVAKREQDHADHNDWNTKPFWIMFALNAALVAVGGGYLIFAALQWRAIERQAEIANTTMVIAQRAFVYVSDVKIMEAFVGGRCPVVAVTYRNSGHTPARFVNLQATLSINFEITDRLDKIAGDTIKQALSFHLAGEEWITHGIVLPPDQVFEEETWLGKPSRSLKNSAE